MWLYLRVRNTDCNVYPVTDRHYLPNRWVIRQWDNKASYSNNSERVTSNESDGLADFTNGMNRPLFQRSFVNEHFCILSFCSDSVFYFITFFELGTVHNKDSALVNVQHIYSWHSSLGTFWSDLVVITDKKATRLSGFEPPVIAVVNPEGNLLSQEPFDWHLWNR